MKSKNDKNTTKVILTFILLNALLFSCTTFRHHRTKVYLSFPDEVNKLIEQYVEYKKDENIFIQMEKKLFIDSCELYYEIILMDEYPQKKERLLYDRFYSSNTFIRVNNKDVPIVHEIDASFQHYFHYPINDVMVVNDHVFVIVFSEEKLIHSGWE